MSKVRAKESFAAFTENGTVNVGIGQAYDSKDPVVKGREHLFESDNDGEDTPRRGRRPKVEQATAAPGEHRDLA